MKAARRKERLARRKAAYKAMMERHLKGGMKSSAGWREPGSLKK